ncbi:hypothetical protein K9L67_00115 [Candidatus Woesearchaeota archaeon]|nr:hypothetical protein [Candidatus Woesearchaeota archaeon]MCF7900611.1 hypothetical protein [Candidatus Woesearchaeota archaeon]MCF8013899.1 hypothetical protein [Candidatus Woesearchaeota archaeon]
MKETKPKPRFQEGYKPDRAYLTSGRYGTEEMIEIWGAEKTADYSLKVQGEAAITLSEVYPHIVAMEDAQIIKEKASLEHIAMERIEELEDKTGHDIIAINTALEEKLPASAAKHVNKAKTSADTTQPAKALQIKSSLEIIADSVENLRDIVIEKSIEFKNKPYMGQSHLYDAVPTSAGRAFAHYAELLQSGLKLLKFVYDNSIIGKWADAIGDHHSAKTLGMDGIKIQEKYCEKLGIGFMDAPAQVPGLEYEADIMYSIARLSGTMENIARFIAMGRGDDANIFLNTNPKRKKGSSAMPHKDAKNGNPTTEEQTKSMNRFMTGNLVTAMMNIEMPYARDLSASSNMRIILEDSFKFMDHATRRLASTVYWIGYNDDRGKERVHRTYGVVTSPQVMAYLNDSRYTSNPMTRSEAHDLVGKLATKAWETKTQFIDVLLKNKEITSRLDENILKKITDPSEYIGESRKIIDTIKEKHYKKQTLNEVA